MSSTDPAAYVTGDQEMMFDYATYVSSPAPGVADQLKELYEDGVAKYGDWGVLMPVAPLQGYLLAWLAGLVGARSALEVGTFTGYSTVYLADALRKNGVGPASTPEDRPIVTCELVESVARQAEANFAKTGTDGYIDVRVGNALDTIKALPSGRQFDLVFVDADKPSYKRYYDAIMDAGLLSPGGVMVFDNSMMKGVEEYVGLPADPEYAENEAAIAGDQGNFTASLGGGAARPVGTSMGEGEVARAKALHAFNMHLRGDGRVSVWALPILTGMLLVRRV